MSTSLDHSMPLRQSFVADTQSSSIYETTSSNITSCCQQQQCAQPSEVGANSIFQRLCAYTDNMSKPALIAATIGAFIVAAFALAIVIAAVAGAALALPYIAIAGAAVGIIALAGLAVKYAVDHSRAVDEEDCCDEGGWSTAAEDSDWGKLADAAVYWAAGHYGTDDSEIPI